MMETYFVRDLLLHEVETEIGKTRRLFEALPDGSINFKPYEKSLTLGRLAGHTIDLFRLMALTLTISEIDMAVAWQPYNMVSKGELLLRFEQNNKTLLVLSQLLSKPRMPPSIILGPSGEARTCFSLAIDLPTVAIKGSTRLFTIALNLVRTFAPWDCHYLECMAPPQAGI